MPGSTYGSLPPDIKAIFEKLDSLLYNDDDQNKTLPEPFRTDMTNGLNCDELPDAYGEFGRTPSNPIPTNGPLGEVIYLSRLRTNAGSPVMFHRLGSEEGGVGHVDVYEVLSLDGKVRETLFLSMYHPRKSKNVPSGYTYAEKLDPSNSTYGVNHIVANFPQKLDAHIRKWQMEMLGIPLPVGHVRETINGSRLTPSILDEGESADQGFQQREKQEDFLKLVEAIQDPRFKGQNRVRGTEKIMRPARGEREVQKSQHLRKLLRDLDGALSEYISIHNDFFAFKLRKLPIPFLFSPMDFEKSATALKAVSAQLNEIIQSLSPDDFSEADILVEYTRCLRATVDKLSKISDRLEEKANGTPYKHREYKEDMKEYDALVHAYTGLGVRLTTWVRSRGLFPIRGR